MIAECPHRSYSIGSWLKTIRASGRVQLINAVRRATRCSIHMLLTVAEFRDRVQCGLPALVGPPGSYGASRIRRGMCLESFSSSGESCLSRPHVPAVAPVLWRTRRPIARIPSAGICVLVRHGPARGHRKRTVGGRGGDQRLADTRRPAGPDRRPDATPWDGRSPSVRPSPRICRVLPAISLCGA